MNNFSEDFIYLRVHRRASTQEQVRQACMSPSMRGRGKQTPQRTGSLMGGA